MIGVAISGLGEVSKNHYRGVKSTKYGRLVGVYSHSVKRAIEVAREWGAKYYSSFNELVEDPEVKVVIICSSDEHHYPQALRAMEGGKHVLVEKPLSLEMREVVHMAKVSMEKGVILMPVHNYIFRPKVQRAKALIESKEIGEPAYALFIVTQRMEEGVARRYHGALFTQAYHSIYVSNYLLGIPIEIQAMWSRITYREISSDEVFVATLKYRNGAIANIVANWAADDISATSWMWLDKIVGTKGVITISSFEDVIYSRESSFMMGMAVDYRESFVALARHFIDEVLVEGATSVQTVYDAILVHDIMDKMKESAELGKRIRYKPPKLERLFKEYGFT